MLHFKNSGLHFPHRFFTEIILGFFFKLSGALVFFAKMLNFPFSFFFFVFSNFFGVCCRLNEMARIFLGIVLCFCFFNNLSYIFFRARDLTYYPSLCNSCHMNTF